MEFSITSAAFATLISAITSALVTLWLNKSNRQRHIDDQLDTIIKISIQYPYLENSLFTSSWNEKKNSNEDEYLRYDAYCILLFNFLSRVASFYKYDRKKIENYIAIKDWIRLHKDYWLSPASAYENIDSYDDEFKTLINYYIK
jgi:hypothetical protein